MDQNFQSQVRTAPDIKPKPTILQVILTKTIRVEKNLKDKLKSQITNQKSEKQDKKKLKDVLKEEEKKKKSTKPKLFQKVKNVTPKTGILDSIANFLVFTFFGWLFTNTQKYLPKLLGIVYILKGAADGIGWLTRGILDALSSFIGAGYKVYDAIKGKTDEIKAKPVQEKFDSVTKALDDNFSNLLKFFEDINALAQKSPETPPSNPSKPNNSKPNKPSEQTPKPKGAATGAYIGPTRGGEPVNKPISRRLKTKEKPKKPRKVNIPEGNIGSDVGGEKYIREYYGSPKVGIGGIIGIFKPKGGIKRKTPVDTMTTISKSLRGRNNLFGDIASISSDVALGKKPKDDIYKNTAKDVLYLAQLITQNQKVNGIQQTIGMADGGMITSPLQAITDSAETLNIIQMIIKKSIENKINSALNELKNSITASIKKEEEGEPAGGPDGGVEGELGYFGSGIGISGTGVNKGQLIAKRLMVDLNISAAAAAGIVGNLMLESGLQPDNVENGKGYNDGPINNIPPGTLRVGYGWGQWTNDRLERFRKFLKERKADNRPATDEDNYAYLINELTTTEKIRGHWQGYNGQFNIPEDDPEKAAIWFMMAWERPGVPHKDARIDHAKNVFNKIKGLDREKILNQFPPKTGSRAGAITASQVYPLGLGQGRDVSREPGIDFTYRGGKTLALYPGTVLDIDYQFNPKTGRGYGNYVLIESIDPNTGRRFTTLYAHFGDGKIFVRKGSIVQSGTPIGVQPNANIRGHFTGSGSGEHTSADFFEPNGRTPYRGKNRLITQILDTFSGKNPYPISKPTQQPPNLQQASSSSNYSNTIKPRDQVSTQMGQLDDALRRPTQHPSRPQQPRSSRPPSIFTTNTKIDPTKGKVLKSTKIDNFGTITIREVDGKRIISLDSYIVKPDFEEYIRYTKDKKLIDAITPPNFFQRLMGGLSQNPIPQIPNETQLASNNLENNKIVGMKKGGLVSNSSNIPTGYASYERPGGATIFVIQEVIDVKMMEKNTPVVMPVPFPVSSGVNNISNNRA